MGLIKDQQDLQLIRSRDDNATCRIFHKLKKNLRGFFRQYGRGYVACAGDYAVIAITILIEKEEAPILTCSLLTYLYSIAKNQFKMDLMKFDELYLNEDLLNKLAVVDNMYEEIEKSERKLLVTKSLKRIDKRCRVILDVFCRDLCSQEASDKLAYKSEKVYLVKKSECLKKLKFIMWRRRDCRELFGTEED